MNERVAMKLSRRSLLAGLSGLGAVSLLAAGGLPLAGMPASAATGPQTLSPRDREDLDRVEAYLNGIKSFKARFQQHTDKEGLSRGRIYVRRPGKMRIEYDQPSPILLVSDGTMISYYDPELDQLNSIPLSSSPAWFLLRDRIKFGDDVTVTGVQRSPGGLQISMYQTDEPDAGSVSVIFRDNPLELQQWTITDPQGQKIRIGLFDASFGGTLENALFATPRVQGKRGRKK